MTGENVNFGRVAVLMGGSSAEREISLLSGRAVVDALVRSGVDAFALDTGADMLGAIAGATFDRAMIMLHGGNGEDGKVQALLELMGTPYTGSGVLSSALAMDKMRSKLVWRALDLSTPDAFLLNEATDWETIIEQAGPFFVKPVCEGSSIGISFATEAAQLQAAYESARRYDSQVMAERWIDGPEFSVSILGGQVLPVIELRTQHEFYDYDAKYLAEDTQYICPSELDAERTLEIQRLAKVAYDAIGCSGWGRVDLMQDKQGKFWLLEVNTVPGMTSHSLVPMAARAAGMNFDQLVMNILSGSTAAGG